MNEANRSQLEKVISTLVLLSERVEAIYNEEEVQFHALSKELRSTVMGSEMEDRVSSLEDALDQMDEAIDALYAALDSLDAAIL